MLDTQKVMLAGLQAQALGQGNIGHEVMHALDAADLGFGQVHQVGDRGQRL